MAEEDKNETTEPTVAPEGEASETAAPEAPASEAAEAPAPPVEDAPAAEPAERLHPKEARRRVRSRHEGEARPSRTAQERDAERRERRRAKAKLRSAYRIKARAKAKQRRAEHPAAEAPPVHAETTGAKTVRQGIVVSDKADKTITVRIDMVRRHRRYQKVMRSSATLHVHDERNDAHEGDTVRVVESRPLSRTKRWRLVEILERAR